ncbi:hypothetical protein BVY01_04470 [bacterium I07]|nr:hypothetical protein BVY01_04470 [bacterium I07]
MKKWLLACVIFLTANLYSSAKVLSDHQLQNISNRFAKYLKTGNEDLLISCIDTTSQKYESIARAWRQTYNNMTYLYQDTGRIQIDLYVWGSEHDDDYISLIPNLQNAKPNERFYEYLVPILKIRKFSDSKLITDLIFPYRLINQIHFDVDALLNPSENYIRATCSVQFETLDRLFESVIFTLYPDLTIHNILLNGVKIDVDYHRWFLCLKVPKQFQDSSFFNAVIEYSGVINDEDNFYIREDGTQLCFWPWFPYVDPIIEDALGSPQLIQLDPFSHEFTLQFPERYYSLSNWGKLEESSVRGNYRIEGWNSPKVYGDIGILLGKWTKLQMESIGNIHPTLYLKNDLHIELETLKQKITRLITFYSSQFSEPSNKFFNIVEAPVYWNCENYISSNLGIMDHEMAHFWWRSNPLNWFFHSLTEYSDLLFKRELYGETNFHKRLIEKWCDYYQWMGSDPNLVLESDNIITYYLGPIMQYYFNKEIGDENLFQLCRKLTSLPYDRFTFSHRELMQMVQEVVGRDYETFFNGWIKAPIKLEGNNLIPEQHIQEIQAIHGYASQRKELYRKKDWTALIELCDVILKKKTDFKMIWLRHKGNFLLKSNQYEDALKTYQLSIQEFDPKLDREDRLDRSYLRQAQTYDLLHSRDKAMKYYNIVIESLQSPPEVKASAFKYSKKPFTKDEIDTVLE